MGFFRAGAYLLGPFAPIVLGILAGTAYYGVEELIHEYKINKSVRDYEKKGGRIRA